MKIPLRYRRNVLVLPALLAFSVAGCSSRAPADRVEAHVENVPPEAAVVFFVRQLPGGIEQIPFYKFNGTGKFLSWGADWHLSRTAGGDISLEPGKETSFFVYLQEPGVSVCGTVVRTIRREWFVSWFDTDKIAVDRETFRFDLSKSTPMPISDLVLREMGIVWGIDEPRFVDHWSGDPLKDENYTSPSWPEGFEYVLKKTAEAEGELEHKHIEIALTIAANAVDVLEIYCHEKPLPRENVRAEIRLVFRSFSELKLAIRDRDGGAALDALGAMRKHSESAQRLLK